jgi:hypothetical protein
MLQEPKDGFSHVDRAFAGLAQGNSARSQWHTSGFVRITYSPPLSETKPMETAVAIARFRNKAKSGMAAMEASIEALAQLFIVELGTGTLPRKTSSF